MSVAVRSTRYADVALLRRSLARGSRDVVLRETPTSTVFLAGPSAYKLRKPVRTDVVDQRTVLARADACRREVEIDAQLEPGIVIGVRAVVPGAEGGDYLLEAADDPRAIDHVVEMRRFDESRTMRTLVQRGALTAEQASAAGGRLARFHRSATHHRGGVDYRTLVDRNLALLLPLIHAHERRGLQRFATAFLLGSAYVLEARAAAGKVVDGHGDLRAENLVFDDGQVLIVGRAQADELRVVDVADELAVLLVELADLTGTNALGDAVLIGYTAAGGAPQPDALLAFFGTYRAQVRARVVLLGASHPGVDADAARARARRLLALSRRLAWRARGPLVLIVTGAAGAGASALAQALGTVSGLPVLTSDDQIAGERAAIVDATAGDAPLPRAFAEQRADAGAAHPLVVECRSYSAAPERRDPSRLLVDRPAPIEAQVDEVESWLDSSLAAGLNA